MSTDAHVRVVSRNDVAESDFCKGTCVPNFASDHLRNAPLGIFAFEQEQALVDKILGSNKDSAALATPLASLLTEYSSIAYGRQNDLRLSPMPPLPLHSYIFLNHQHNIPEGHPFNAKDREDILVVPGPLEDYKPVPGRDDYRGAVLYEAVSLVECKPVGKHRRAASYAYQILETRSEMPGVYALWARPSHYEIMWVDPSGVIVSPQFKWSNLTPLRNYVWSLYDPPATHFILDTTMTRHVGNTHVWNIRHPSLNGEKQEYCTLKRTFAGSPFGRRTSVYVSTSLHGDSVLVIKDSYIDNQRRYMELPGLMAIHELGIFPGVIRLMPSGGSGSVSPPITTALSAGCPNRTSRVKHRLVLGSTGEGLLQASSVLEMLVAIFDILEIHRALFKRRNILHRDISIYNILIRPRHNPRTMEGKKLIDNPPVFIKAILQGIMPASNNQVIDESESALLIDFDNYAEFQVESEVNDSLKARTGTPMFIARSACVREVRGNPKSQLKLYEPMPQLEGEAKQLYIQTYGEEMYDDFCDEEGVTFHGVKPPKTFPDDPKFYHLPEHDVESAFWVLYYALIQANPDPQVDVPREATNIFYDTMDLFYTHKIHDGADSRDSILQKSKKALERTLHPRLASLSDMLTTMISQILPEYGHLPDLKTQRPEHLHEAMRRILLTQIVEMLKSNTPIPLQAGNPRKYLSEGEKETQTKNGDKTPAVDKPPTRVSEMKGKRKAQSTSEVRAKRVCVSENLNRNDMPHYLPKQRLP